MPSRQRRLDTKYFSQPSTSQSTTRPKSSGRPRRRQTPSDDDQDSEGSAGMAAIRLSESPDKKKTSMKAGKQGVEEHGGSNSEDDDVLLLSPDKVRAGLADLPEPSQFEREEEQDDQTLVEGELDGLDPAIDYQADGPPTGDDEPELSIIAEPPSATSSAPSSALPRKRVSLGSSLRSQAPLTGRGPMPKAQTRLRTVPETADSETLSQPNRRLVPYIELESWPTSRKAFYTVSRSTHKLKGRRVSFQAPNEAEVRPAPMADVLEVSDDDIIALSPPAPVAEPPKRQRMVAVELPSSPRTDAGPSSKRGPTPRIAPGSSAKSRLATVNGKSTTRTEKRPKGNKRPHTPISGIESADELHDDTPLQRSVDKGKGKKQAKVRARDKDAGDSSGSERNSPAPRASKKGKEKAAPVKFPKAAKKRRVSISSDERENMLSEIKMDESKRFKTQSRLRKKAETDFQRKLRKLKEKRQKIIGSDTESEEEESEEDEDEDDTSDSAPDSIEEDFIEEDDGIVADGMLPHEFSLNSAQTPEWKFKVVFHYFVLLVVEGTDILPLKGDMKEYMVPQLEDLRRKIEDFRDQRVRSQIWPHKLVNALKAYPTILIASLDYAEEHCFACNRSNWKSRFRVELRGDKYDRDTYESKVKRRERVRKEKDKAKAKKKKANGRKASTSSLEDDDSDSDSDSDEVIGEPEYFLGSHCKKKTHVYHQMAHWERTLYLRIKGWYHDLLRANDQEISSDSASSSTESDDDEDAAAKSDRRHRREAKKDEIKRRIKRLKAEGGIPENYGNVDAVTDWMDRQGHILNELKWMEDLQEQSRRLEFDKSRDE